LHAVPVVTQPAHRSSACSITSPAGCGCGPRRCWHRWPAAASPVALTVLQRLGGSTQQALATTLAMDGTTLSDSSTNWKPTSSSNGDAHRRPATPLVELTEAGADQLAKAESALTEVEQEMLGALDANQRETLYNLLQLAATGTGVTCPRPARIARSSAHDRRSGRPSISCPCHVSGDGHAMGLASTTASSPRGPFRRSSLPTPAEPATWPASAR